MIKTKKEREDLSEVLPELMKYPPLPWPGDIKGERKFMKKMDKIIAKEDINELEKKIINMFKKTLMHRLVCNCEDLDDDKNCTCERANELKELKSLLEQQKEKTIDYIDLKLKQLIWNDEDRKLFIKYLRMHLSN